MLKISKFLNIIYGSDNWELGTYKRNNIFIKEIWYFEKFLKERFLFGNIDMEINYQKDTRLKSIKEEWRNIICYMAHKYPLMKPMLLMKSDIEIKENIIEDDNITIINDLYSLKNIE